MTEQAVGFIETRNWSALLAASDAMNKAAPVESLGDIQSGGGYVTTLVGGDVGAATAAVQAGSAVAKKLGEFVSENVIPRLHEDVRERFIANVECQAPVSEYSALGIVEAIGFAAMTMAADAGCKAANVELVGQFVPGGGHIAAVFRGDVAEIEAAVESGARAAAQVNKVVGQHVISRPHVGLRACFPVGGKQKPLEMPTGTARGFIETKGFIPIVEATDTAIKAAPVRVLEWQRVGSGFMAIVLEGDVGAVRNAVQAGAAAARAVGELKSSLVLAGPDEAIQKIIPRPKKKS